MKHYFNLTLLIFSGGILNGHVVIPCLEKTVVQIQNIPVKCFQSVSV